MRYELCVMSYAIKYVRKIIRLSRQSENIEYFFA